MGRHIVTVAGAVAWVAALWMIVQLRGTRQHAATTVGDMAVGPRLREATGHVAGTAAGGLVAGVLVLGLGGRFMMRLLAATSPERSQGRITDAEEVVGRVTAGGTVGFIIFAGAFGGILGAILYSTLRRWLPRRSVLAGLVAGGIGGGLLARPSGLLDPDNHDFAILEPRWLAVLLCSGLVLTFALCGATLIDRFAPSWPRPSFSIEGVAGVAVLLPLLLVPPLAAWAVLVVALRTVRPPGATPTRTTVAAHRFATLLALAGAAGAIWILASATEILTA